MPKTISNRIKKAPARETLLPGLLLLCAAFLVTRLTILLTAAEQVSYIDELRVGNIALAMLHRFPGSLWQYQVDYYSGESLVLAFAALPFFKILGPTLLTLKLPTLFFSAATFTGLTVLMKRHFGLRAALTTAALFLFAPANLIQQFLVVMTGHSECLFFSLAAVFCFMEYLSGCKPRIFLALAGAFHGFAFWMYNASGIAALTCLAVWFLKDRAFWRSAGFFIFAASAAAGALPGWIRFFEYPEGAAFFLQGIGFQPLAALKLLLIQFPLSYVPSGLFAEPWSARLLSLAYSLGFVLTAAAWVVKKPSFPSREAFLKTAFFLFYPFCFFAVYAVVSFTVFDPLHFSLVRYLTPLQFWGIPLLSFLLLDYCKTAKAAALFVILGILSWPPLFFQEPLNQVSSFKGYSYYLLADYLPSHPAPQTVGAQTFEWAGREVGAADGFDYTPASFSKFQNNLRSFFREVDFERFRECCESGLRGKARAWFYLEAGRRYGYAPEPPAFHPLEPADAGAFYQGIGHESLETALFFSGPAPDRHAFFEQLNAQTAYPIPAAHETDFLRGLGWEIRIHFADDPARGLSLVKRLPPQARRAALEGFELCEAWHAVP
jgi:hypothetical protein